MNVSPIISAQSTNINILLDENVEIEGPVTIEYTCNLIACMELELKVINNGIYTNKSDSHRVSWSGLVNGSFSWQVYAEAGIGEEDITSKIIIDDNGTIEMSDLTDNIIFNAENYGDYFYHASPCQMDSCNNLDNINLKILIDECAIVIPLMFSSGVADGKLFSEMFKKMDVGMYEYLSKNTLIHPIFLNYLK